MKRLNIMRICNITTNHTSYEAIPNSQPIMNQEMQMTEEDSLQKDLVEAVAHLVTSQFKNTIGRQQGLVT